MSNGHLLVSEEKSAVSQVQQPWWRCALLLMASGFVWVASIPLLLFALGGSMQPHLGWTCAVLTAVGMFAILVQVDQRLAAGAVFLVATWLTSLNGRNRVCSPNQELLDFQYSGYSSYHKRCELHGALDSIQHHRSFYACHPHGVLSIGFISNVCWGRKFHEVVGRCFFLIDPTLRHGGFRNTRTNTMQELMQKGESMAMIPGAYQEATAFSYGRERVALSKRKGFVKYCLKYGYRLHPVYTFGESETYYTMGGFEQLRFWLNRKGIPTVAFWGLPWCPLLPRSNVEMLTFVGPALELPQISDPTPEEVDKWHAKYTDALVTLFNKHKAEAGKPTAVLEIL